MPTISQRGIDMPASPIRKLVPLANRAKAKGTVVYHLNIGQPDLATPEVALRAAHHLDREVLEYSPSEGILSFRKKLVEYYHKFNIDVCTDDIIITTGGSEAVFFSFMACLDPGDEIIVPEPAYANYMAFAISCGAVIKTISSTIDEGFALPSVEKFEALITPRTKAILICNPNNPTGSLITPDKLKTILTHCKETNTYVMIDETYIEFVPDVNELSAIPLTELFDNVIILRGTSKFFATPGLRLGYAITSNSQILTDINTNKNPWMINSLAVVAGETMFLDEEYIDKTRSLILSEKTRCRQLIEESHKFKLYPSYSNFYLLKILDEGVDAHMLFERAIRQGMMIRDCSTFPGLEERFIRFCIMKPEDNTRLINCLTQ